MKRLIVFVLITVLMCVIGMNFVEDFNIGNLFPNAMVEVYIDGKYNENGIYSIKNGGGSILFCHTYEVDELQKKYKVAGFTLKIEKDSVKNVLKKLLADVVYVENDYIYGRSIYFCNYIQTQCGLANFQCIEEENFILIGTPILLGCY